jgi:membrane-anchored protein YejM (alkaline phosphatase superfamily)
LIAVMRQAGYDPHVYVSTNLTYAKTRDRLLGDRSKALDFFQAASDHGEDPINKNANDRSVADHMVRFIEKHPWDDKPQFLLLQLDSTHYTYPFPETQAVFRPYSENLILPRAIETAQAALQRAGIFEETLVVLVADHGEGLSPGLQGHGLVGETTKRIPIMFKIPGEAPARSRRLISQRDILPTLAKALQIDLPPQSTRGRVAMDENPPGIMTLAPSGRFGQLTTPHYVVDLRLLFKPTTLTVTAGASAKHAPRSVAERAPEKQAWLPILVEFLAH